ncbi:DUF502 domain-containing protein [Melioribacteraceae bacterium 4301-Me]|uniref:DUF502 domain-containing protein n=1 Tax=Pyranulibacter aquaticus TaxID=3163344 RepID=UPI003599833B
MENLKSFVKTTLFGGFLIVLPIIVLIFVLNWFFDFLTEKISPITNLLIQTARINEFVASLTAVIIILLLFFVVGLVVQTEIGKFTFSVLEDRFLKRVPLYKIIKETVTQLFGGEKILFKSVALVKLYGSDTLLTAFVTDEHENGYITVFIPSAPAPTGGYIYHVRKEDVFKIDYPIDDAMRSILSLGAGSKALLSKLNTNFS